MPTPTRLLAAALTALLLALAVLAGCGDSGEETTSAPAEATTAATTAGESTASSTTVTDEGGTEQPVLDPHIAAEQAITEFLTSPDAESACAGLSPPLLGETYGDLAGCRNGRPPESLAKSVDISDIEVDGEQVTATATPTGGAYDGTEIDFTVAVHGNLALIAGIDADVPVGP